MNTENFHVVYNAKNLKAIEVVDLITEEVSERLEGILQNKPVPPPF